MITALALMPGCSVPRDIAVRPQASAFVAGEKSSAFRVTEARAHFRLGNVALALEGFRRALREDPSSVDALNGLASCYDRMGRFDLSRGLYEKALALAPDDARLYINLATSLSLQGRGADAVAVREELAKRLGAGPAISAPAQTASPPQMAAVDPSPVLAETEQPSANVHLERLNLGEVALVTRREPVVAAAPRRPAPRQLSTSSGVIILNAARVDRLAAGARDRLRLLGFRDVAIGDAARVLPVSRITYPEHRRSEAKRVARQLGINLRQPVERPKATVVILLGRDAVRRRSAV
jgi:tetratricopeptide (TPR) repeat protein